MTNILLSAAVATNIVAGDLVWTNMPDRLFDTCREVTQRCVVDRETWCPVCQNVTTQQVDITDVYDHHRQLRALDRRCEQDALRMCRAETVREAEKVVRLEAELKAAKDAIARAGTDIGLSCYWDGYTNALLKTAEALRRPAGNTVVRLFAPDDRRLLLKLAASLETAAAETAASVSVGKGGAR